MAIPLVDKALLGRTVHKVFAPERGTAFTEVLHEGQGARAHRSIGMRDGEAFGFDQQPMQARDAQPMVSGNAGQRAGLGFAPGERVFHHREWGEL